MMKPILYIIGILLLSVSVAATTEDSIRLTAKSLMNVTAIDAYIYNGNHYKYSAKEQPLYIYWQTRIGDCTEMAKVRYIMYDEIGLEAILVHGYIMKDGRYGKHDFVVYKIGNRWTSVEKENGYTLIIEGRGVW